MESKTSIKFEIHCTALHVHTAEVASEINVLYADQEAEITREVYIVTGTYIFNM